MEPVVLSKAQRDQPYSSMLSQCRAWLASSIAQNLASPSAPQPWCWPSLGYLEGRKSVSGPTAHHALLMFDHRSKWKQ